MTFSLSAEVKTTLGKYDIAHFHAEGLCAMLWILKLYVKHFKDTHGRRTVFIPNGVNKPVIREPQLIKKGWI